MTMKMMMITTMMMMMMMIMMMMMMMVVVVVVVVMMVINLLVQLRNYRLLKQESVHWRGSLYDTPHSCA